MKIKKQPYLPKEWIQLVKEAMESNKTKDEFRGFLQQEKEKREKHNSSEASKLA